MKSREPNFNRDDWDDFVHSTAQNAPSGQDLFRTYQAFMVYVEKLPKAELVKLGWMKSKEDVGSLSNLFFRLYRDKNKALFRKSKESNLPLLALWLAQARANAELAFHKRAVPEFRELSSGDLHAIAQLSVDVGIIPKLAEQLGRKGVVLIFLPALPGMKTDGAVFKLASGNPAIALSLRFSRIDYFWFTLLHELAHIVRHMAILNEPICDCLDTDDDAEEIEIEANRLAKASIVAASVWRNCDPKYNQNREAVETFARKIHVHPGLVAGLLRRESNNYSRYSDLVNEVDVRALLFPK